MAVRVLLAVALAAVTVAAQQPARDTPAQKEAPPPPAGRISGRVVAADTGRPVKRARVVAYAQELSDGRAALTDDGGTFDLTELPAGRYTLNVSKAGFVSLSYGQRRPLQAGTPLQLADGQQLKGVDFRLPRGGVITGHVFDEDGDALPGTTVRVWRYQYLQGDRQLVPVGNAQSDDRGQYRVWGLTPGDYYVSAVARNAVAGRFGGGFAGGFGRGGFAGRGLPTENDDEDQLGYAPTYFPGVSSAAEARPVTVGLSQEVSSIDFGVRLVRTSRIKGLVTDSDGSAASSGNVQLMPDSSAGGGPMGTRYASRIRWDGAFDIANVPPGRYVLHARGNDTDPPEYTEQPLTVAGGDMPDVTVILMPGATIKGTVAFEASPNAESVNPTDVRITAPSFTESSVGPNPNARPEKDGHFTLEGVPVGSHLVRANNVPRGWMLKAVVVNGQDVTDQPIDLRSGQTLDDVTVVFTDRIGQISGTVTDGSGQPVTEFTVLVFPTDTSLWRAQARQIMTSRPDQNGKYQLKGLPPGEYYVATVDPAESGEWFEPAFLDEHRASATTVTLGEGEAKSRDFEVKPEK